MKNIEDFKKEIELLELTKKTTGLNAYYTCRYNTLKELENLILFGVGIELPTKEETDTESKRLADYYYLDNQTFKRTFDIGFNHCYNWLKNKNKVKR